MSQQTTSYEDEITYCEVHPDRETALRCNKCNRLMCAQCAVPTPVGYRCHECVRRVEDKFYSGTTADYIVAGLICAGLSAIASGIISAIGFILLAIFIGFPAGGLISEVALRAIQRRRGRYSGNVGVASVLVGALVGVVVQVYSAYQNLFGDVLRLAANAGISAEQLRVEMGIPSFSRFLIDDLTTSWGVLIFVGLAAYAVYSRMKS